MGAGKWIVVSTECSVSNAKNLSVFDKSSLYQGAAINGSNFHQFYDPANANTSFRDDPVQNVSAEADGREYLVEATTASGYPTGYAAVVYSYLQGSVDSPSFVSNSRTAISSIRGTMYPNVVSAPGCSSCIHFFSNSWIHSSVEDFTTPSLQPVILTTAIYGDPYNAQQTIVVDSAFNEQSGGAEFAENQGGYHGGAMASEITVPSPYTGTNYLPIAWTASDDTLYPDVEWVLWDLDKNTFASNTLCILKKGTVFPSNTASRWVDFIDAAAPFTSYGTHSFLLGGPYATQPSYQSEGRAVGWQFATDYNPGQCT